MSAIKNATAIMSVTAVLAMAAASWMIVTTYRNPRQATPPNRQQVANNPVKDAISRDREKIEGCKWWSRAMSQDDVDALLLKIVATNSGNFIWIDDSGAAATIPSSHYSGVERAYWHVINVPGIGVRRSLVIVDGPRRFTATEAAEKLSQAIEAAEFADGAGR